MAKRASFGNIVLKKLSDITNLQTSKTMIQDEKPPEIFGCDKEYVDQLMKERTTLIKLIAERDKIIELSGAELQKLRATLQKLQLQNWNLAQSNSQMSAELRLGREKVKALQHELVCKDVLLKAKTLGLEGKSEVNCQKTCPQACMPISSVEEEEEAALNLADIDEKPRKQARRRTARSQSMGASFASQKVEDKEKVENKRRCLKRQSARFRSQEKEPAGNLFEIEDAKFSGNNNSLRNLLNTPLNEEKEESCVSTSEAGLSRSSIGRPMRKAAVKVHSYKEIPVNIKMRRNE
ncbi:hypothetical protein UlMin_028968 [Ulmus minor]